MKKFIALIVLVVSAYMVQAQTCPLTSCTDSLSNTQLKDSLFLAPGYTNVKWTVVAGPGAVASTTATNTSISGLKPGTTTVLFVTSTSGNSTILSSKVITVAPAPVPTPSIASVALVGGQLQITLSDGLILKL